MKILRVTSLGFQGGGADNGIALMQDVLAKRGHEVKILSSDLRPELPHFNHFSFKALSHNPFFAKLVYRSFYPKSYFALRSALKAFKPDIVQLHTMSEVSPSVLFLLKRYPTVLTVHGSEDFTSGLLLWSFPRHLFKEDGFEVKNLTRLGYLHYRYHRAVSSRMYKWGFHNVDAFVSLSGFMQRELRKDGIESVHIPNATVLFDPQPANISRPKLLYVGRLEKIKGVQFGIEAVSMLRSAYPGIELTVVGEGNYAQELQMLAHSAGVGDRVHFVGHKNRDEVGALYARSGIVLVPSVWPEPFGKVGIEAMSVGRPVVASKVGGIEEWLIDGKTGYLVPPGDAAAIAQKVSKLLSDQTLYEKMSLHAIADARHFSIEAHTDRILRLYEAVIKKYRH